MGFLKQSAAIVDLECKNMSLADTVKVIRAKDKTFNKSTAFTVFYGG
jgi:hypothetical protein